MSERVPDLLQVAAALLVATSVWVLTAFGLEIELAHPVGTLPARAFAAIAERNRRRLPQGRLAQLEGWLRRAGRPRDLDAAQIVAAVQVTAVAALIAGLMLSACLGLGPGGAAVCALAGAAGPLLWVRDHVLARHRSIARALPWSLDLLTLSVEAGLDFSAALAKVVEKGRTGPLSHELSTVLKELKLGKTREEALRNLARQVELPALTSFVQAVVHADRMGTPLGKVLRVLSTQLRVDRSQRAERLANEAPVKLLLPLVLFIFPTLFLMLFGPLAHQMYFDGSF
jgi:tight adherence protein C